jgi:para-nitrobenzyl esterase
MQPRGNVLATRPVAATDEDCLYVDVYTPSLAGRRPVIVWIHGGGYVHGSAGDPLTDGGRLAATGDVVVVTAGYRLGIFGFAALAPAPAEDAPPASAGLADMLAVLDWVAADIGAFGGDPGNVTLVGESSGGMSVATLLALPASRGRIHRAIVMSGNATSVQPLAAAQATTRAVAMAAGCPPTPGAMRALAATDLLAAQAAASASAAAAGAPLSFRPAIDGAMLRMRPLDALRDGAGGGVPLIVGSTRDEQRLYHPPRSRLDDAGLRARVRQRLARAGAASDQATIAAVVAHYRERAAVREHDARHAGPPHTTPLALWCAIDTDVTFRMPALDIVRARATAQAPTWLYRFDWESPALHGWLGACHALDVPFVFGNLDAPGIARFAGASPRAEALAARLMRLVATFAHHGHPGVDGWLPASAAAPRSLLLDAGPVRCADVDGATRALWDGILR